MVATKFLIYIIYFIFVKTHKDAVKSERKLGISRVGGEDAVSVILKGDPLLIRLKDGDGFGRLLCGFFLHITDAATFPVLSY